MTASFDGEHFHTPAADDAAAEPRLAELRFEPSSCALCGYRRFPAADPSISPRSFNCSDKPSRLIRFKRGTACYRFTLLFLSVLVVFAGYFQFDLPAITVNYILPKLNINMEQYSSIFIGYSVSNTIVPLLSGPFFGRFGKWKGVAVIATTVVIGVGIVYAGMVADSFSVVVLGRTIYGLGGESVFVGVDILVTKWFQGQEIGFAYGLIQAAGQAGSFTALYTVPPMVEHWGGDVNKVYMVSFLLSCGALACLGIARIIEKTAYGRKAPKADVENGHLHDDTSLQYTAAGGFAAAVMDANANEAQAKKHATDKPRKDEHVSLLTADAQANNVGGTIDEEEDEEEEVDVDIVSPELHQKMSDNLWFFRKYCPPLYHVFMFLGIGHLAGLDWRFGAVLGGIICYSSAFYTFLAFGPKWLMTVYGLSEDEAGQTAGIIAIFSMAISPTIGLVMDKRGGQRYVCFFAMMSACIWFTIMGYTKVPPAVCIVFAGMSYSLLPASLYPLLPAVVPEESFTSVYAILNSLINLVFTVVLAIAGKVLGQDTADLAALGPAGTWAHTAMLGRLGGWADLAAAGSGLGGLGEHDATDVDPQKFEYVFSMFVTITAVGTIATGFLAWDGYKNGTGWQVLKAHH